MSIWLCIICFQIVCGQIGLQSLTVRRRVVLRINKLFGHVLILFLVKAVVVATAVVVMQHRVYNALVLHLVKVDFTDSEFKAYSYNRCFSFYLLYLAVAATLRTSIRDPNLETSAYTLPNTMEFFGQAINRLWVG